MNDNVAASLQKAGFWVTLAAFGYVIVVMISTGLTMNPATYIMWTLLDVLIVYNMRKSGNVATARIMTAFATGAGVIALITIGQLILGKVEWRWSSTESVVAVAFGGLLCMRFYLGSSAMPDEKFQANMGTTAMLVAGIPSLIDALNHPANVSSIFWGACTIGCILTLCGSGKGFTARYMPVGGIVLNGAIACIGVWH